MLADGKHFRAGVRRRKRAAVFFLDDASRFGLGVDVHEPEPPEDAVQAAQEQLGGLVGADHGSRRWRAS